ncbi:hypothetical protein [Tissierella sp.]|uniref:hypothetical protein n=1 Tax=Tissierella sp. TaxID=41274 RepID=UPI002860D5F0|nr:hypothetical protein [Tissierella sp.]MDR7856103.1 hypothetical protein [Tissierella sp.]
MSKNKKTTEDIEVLEDEIVEQGLLPFNPLMGSIAISPDDEDEQKYELIQKQESLAVLNKQVLEAKQRETELIVDNKKLDAAKKLIDGINAVADKALSEETLTKILTKEDLNPMDLKFMAESMDKMANTLKSLMKPSVQDEYGNRKRTKIVAQFQTQSGEKASIGVSIDNDD